MIKKPKNTAELIINFLNKNKGIFYKQKKISRALEISNSKYPSFKKLLRSLSEEGKIEHGRKNSYRIRDKCRTVEGIISYSTRGFGFLQTEDGTEFFINAYDIAPAFHHDKVLAEKNKRQKGEKPEAKVIKILKRANEPVFAILKKNKHGWIALPELPAPLVDFHIIGEYEKIKDGQMVELMNLEWDHPKTMPRAEIKTVLGSPDDPRDDVVILKKMFGLKDYFPRKVNEELKEIKLPAISKILKDRLDLREMDIFTIDPPNAKDFDDAVSLEKTKENNWLLGVHIADVSYYVKPGSALDKEARKRSTSVYLGESVVSMLPEKISNELCSLQPGKERLTYSIFIEISPDGRVLSYKINTSVIKSKKRFTYKEANGIIKKGEGKFFSILSDMNNLSKKLFKRRTEKGSIDFDIPEPVFNYNSDGVPSEIKASERLATNRLIEEFMLLANKCIAENIAEKRKKEKLPFVYRIHEPPPEESVTGLYQILQKLGMNLTRPKHFHPKDLNIILKQLDGMPFKNFVEQISLRSMSKAVYTNKPFSHFGLAFLHYTHFTSPIRRYPDLIVHRLLKKYAGKIDSESLTYFRRSLPHMTNYCSEIERKAQEAEREFIKLKQIRYISKKIGEIHKGIITGVIDFGFFVEISDCLVEGLVHVRTLNNDYYSYNEEEHSLKGSRKGRVFRLGDIVNVKVEAVSVKNRRVDFTWVE